MEKLLVLLTFLGSIVADVRSHHREEGFKV